MLELKNTAIVSGTINGNFVSQKSNEVIVYLDEDEVKDLVLEKFANKIAWATGTLTFTLVIDNTNNIGFNNIIINDILDPNLIYLITNSVRINDIPAGVGNFEYNRTTGLLSFNLPTVLPEEKIVITFQVTKRNIEIFILENYATLFSYNMFARNIAPAAQNEVISNVVRVSGLSRASKCRANQINFNWRNGC